MDGRNEVKEGCKRKEKRKKMEEKGINERGKNEGKDTEERR